MINENLLDILVCPKCSGEVKLDEAKQQLICSVDNLGFKIEDSIPIMLIEEAIDLST